MISASLDRQWWVWITDFGSLRVVLSEGAVVFGWLCLCRRWHAAAGWATALFGCGFSILLLKLGLSAQLVTLAGGALESPSGHSALGLVLYGSLAWVLGRNMTLKWRLALLVASLSLAGAIGVSRVVLGDHHMADVIAGLLVGAVWATVFAAVDDRARAPDPRWTLGLVLATVLTVLLAHGHPQAISIAWKELFPFPVPLAVRL